MEKLEEPQEEIAQPKTPTSKGAAYSGIAGAGPRDALSRFIAINLCGLCCSGNSLQSSWERAHTQAAKGEGEISGKVLVVLSDTP